MVNRNVSPTAYFWNCLGSALFVGSIGVAISVARTETLQLELARYKLRTGSALNKVQLASEELEESTRALPIDNTTKRDIQQKIDEADRVLLEAKDEIESEVLTERSN